MYNYKTSSIGKTGGSKQSGNVNISNPSITNTSCDEVQVKGTEKVLGTEEELFTKFPQRRGCPPGSKNKKALKNM